MEYMKIAIVTDDYEYGEAVSRSLLIGNRSFDLSLYECGAFCRCWEKQGQAFREGFDLVLWDSEDLSQVYGGNLVWLTERSSQDNAQRLDDPREKHFTIHKYSPSTAMVAAIFRIYGELTGRRPAGARPDRVEVFAFASWQGGCGCTTVSMAVGQELVRFYRKRVLYLSLEGTESTSMYMSVPDGMKTAGEYLYRLGSAPFLEEYLVRDNCGLEAFAPTGSCNPLGTAQPEEIRRLIPTLMDSGRFDVLIIDAGSGTNELVREALSYADRICLVTAREEPEREYRYRTFLKYGVDLGTSSGSMVSGGRAGDGSKKPQTDAADLLVRVRNRVVPGSSVSDAAPDSMPLAGVTGFWNDSAGTASVKTGIGTEGWDYEMFGSGCPEISITERDSSATLILEGSFGKDIHKLTELCYNGVATERRAG